MSEGVFVKHYDALRPDDEEARSIMDTIKAGDAVTVKIHRPRNLQHFRLYWKLMHTVCENQEHYRTAEELSDAFKLAVGHYDLAFGPKGTSYPKVRSISFAKMDQAKFNLFFNRAINFMCSEVIPGMDSESLRNEVYELLGEGT